MRRRHQRGPSKSSWNLLFSFRFSSGKCLVSFFRLRERRTADVPGVEEKGKKRRKKRRQRRRRCDCCLGIMSSAAKVASARANPDARWGRFAGQGKGAGRFSCLQAPDAGRGPSGATSASLVFSKEGRVPRCLGKRGRRLCEKKFFPFSFFLASSTRFFSPDRPPFEPPFSSTPNHNAGSPSRPAARPCRCDR